MKNFGFTLAEVLITLGVIGVVAAMTMPTVIQKQQKKQTAVRLQKFYNVMSNAFTRYYADEGIMPENFQFDDNIIRNPQNYNDWFKNNIGKFIVYTKVVNTGNGIQVAFADGSGFYSYIPSNKTGYFMYCTQYKYCGMEMYDGKNSFLFQMQNGKFQTFHNGGERSRDELKLLCQKPSMFSPGGTNNTRHFCTALIEMDGWEIKDDYPAW